MPRFNAEKWKPEHDSSPGVFHLDKDCVVLLRHGDGCPCGCGEYPDGAKATFRMGHDARLRGILIRAHLMGVRIRYFLVGSDQLLSPTDAVDVADIYCWREYLDAAVLRRDGKNRELLRRALTNPEFLRAGKWDYTGGQVMVLFKPNPTTGVMDAMYVDRGGEIRKKRVPAHESEEMVK